MTWLEAKENRKIKDLPKGKKDDTDRENQGSL
jgi:hypothetical protein